MSTGYLIIGYVTSIVFYIIAGFGSVYYTRAYAVKRMNKYAASFGREEINEFPPLPRSYLIRRALYGLIPVVNIFLAIHCFYGCMRSICYLKNEFKV